MSDLASNNLSFRAIQALAEECLHVQGTPGAGLQTAIRECIALAVVKDRVVALEIAGRAFRIWAGPENGDWFIRVKEVVKP